jgi:hypothetical protein
MRVVLAAISIAAVSAMAGCASAEGQPDAAVRPDAARLPDAGPRPDSGRGGSVVLNEFVADHTTDDNCEYVEVFGAADTDYSQLVVLVIDGDSTDAGLIQQGIPVGTTNGRGLWVSEVSNYPIENKSKTFLLVADFTGIAGQDLDEDDDGAFDLEPWGEIVDALGIHDGGASDRTYSGDAMLHGTFDGGTSTVGGASRMPDGKDTDGAGDWVRNAFCGQGLEPGCFSMLPCGPAGKSGEAINTPGAANEVL